MSVCVPQTRRQLVLWDNIYARRRTISGCDVINRHHHQHGSTPCYPLFVDYIHVCDRVCSYKRRLYEQIWRKRFVDVHTYYIVYCLEGKHQPYTSI